MTQDCFVRPADPDMCHLLRWKLKSSSWHQSLVRLHFLLLRLFSAFSLMYIWTFPSNFFKEHRIAFVPVLLLMNIKLRWELLRVMFQSKSGNLCSRLLLHSNNLILISRCKQPQMCLEVVGADKQLHSRSKKVSFDPFIQTKYFSPSTAAPGQSSRAGWRAKISPVAPPALAQDKVIVGSGAHCIKHVGFVRYLELCGKKRSKVPFSFLHLQD